MEGMDTMSEFLLEPPVEQPVAVECAPAPNRPALLGGVDWAGLAAEARGAIALVDVQPGEGQRQAWARRGDA